MTSPSDPQFHEESRTGIGGSDAASTLGISQYGTPLGVWLSKMGLTEPGGDSEPAEWGRILEPKVLEQYAIREGYWVLGRNTVGGEEQVAVYTPDGHIEYQHPLIADHGELMGFLRHPDNEFMIAHMDGIAFEKNEIGDGFVPVRGLDAKTTNAYKDKEWDDDDAMPTDYLVQVCHYQVVLYGVTGWLLPFDVPVLIGGQKWKVPTLEYDEELAERVIAREKAFWNDFVKADMPPPSMPQDNMARVYPEEEDGKVVTAAPGSLLADYADMLNNWQSEEKTAGVEVKRFKNLMKEEMGDAARIQGDGWNCTWKLDKGKTKIDWQQVAIDLFEEMDDVVNEHHNPDAQELYDELVEKWTSVAEPVRVFRPHLKGLNPDE